MIDIETLNKYDTKKMYAVYDRWPQIAKNAYNSNAILAKIDPTPISSIDFIKKRL
ncbi:MAG TPA: hypothetical protein VD731_04690 [Nitrosopumilaceae archaeon]|nr:hypothetical protein [Nitrosopumilaceae archaeon]